MKHGEVKIRGVLELLAMRAKLMTREQLECAVWGRAGVHVDVSLMLRKCANAGIAEELRVNAVPECAVARVAVGDIPRNLEFWAFTIAERSKELRARIAQPITAIRSGQLIAGLAGLTRPDPANGSLLQAHIRQTEVLLKFLSAGGDKMWWSGAELVAPVNERIVAATLRTKKSRKSTVLLFPVAMKYGEALRALKQVSQLGEHFEIWM